MHAVWWKSTGWRRKGKQFELASPAMFRHVRNSYHRHYSIYFCKGPDAAPRRRRLENEFLIGGRGQHVDGVERAGEGHKLDEAGKL